MSRICHLSPSSGWVGTCTTAGSISPCYTWPAMASHFSACAWIWRRRTPSHAARPPLTGLLSGTWTPQAQRLNARSVAFGRKSRISRAFCRSWESVATFPAIWRCALTKREVELENKGALMMEQYFVVESVRR